jgi:hypothetical protein
MDKRTIAFLERMDRGKRYEKDIKVFLENNNVNFKFQVAYKLKSGKKYIADFVLDDGTILEATDSNLDKSKGIPFINNKIKKLQEIIEHTKIIIVTTSPETWQKEIPKSICISKADLLKTI